MPVYHHVFSDVPLSRLDVKIIHGWHSVPVIHSVSCTEHPFGDLFRILSLGKYYGPSRIRYANYVDLSSMPPEASDAILGLEEAVEHSRYPPYPVVRTWKLDRKYEVRQIPVSE